MSSKQSALTEHLASLGAVISYGQRAGNITDDIDLVVYTAAISADNPEYEGSLQSWYSHDDQSRSVRSDHEKLQAPYCDQQEHTARQPQLP